MDKISIIIPVYNVEPYIRKCLDSVINQTYKNLEILLIDDGSTDNSGIICDEYAKADVRIKVFHKENGGAESARNIGLKNITGQYVGFVDSDDRIEPDMYEILLDAIKTNNTQISVCPYFKDMDSESIYMKNRKNIPDCNIDTKNMLLYPLERDNYMGFCGYLWNKLFAASLFEDGILFNENIKYGDDVLFYSKLVVKNRCAGSYVDNPLYHYYQRKESIAHSKIIKFRADILTAYKQMEKLFNENGFSDVSYWARGFYCHHASVIAEIAINNNDTETLKFMQNEIRLHLDDYMKTNSEFPEKFENMQRLLKIA